MKLLNLVNAQTVTLAASNVSSRVALPAGNEGDTLILTNTGSVEIDVALGGSTVAATTSNHPILPGHVQAFACNNATHLAGITASGTGTLVVTRGQGA